MRGLVAQAVMIQDFEQFGFFQRSDGLLGFIMIDQYHFDARGLSKSR